jgi:hypothetical protein
MSEDRRSIFRWNVLNAILSGLGVIASWVSVAVQLVVPVGGAPPSAEENLEPAQVRIDERAVIDRVIEKINRRLESFRKIVDYLKERNESTSVAIYRNSENGIFRGYTLVSDQTLHLETEDDFHFDSRAARDFVLAELSLGFDRQPNSLTGEVFTMLQWNPEIFSNRIGLELVDYESLRSRNISTRYVYNPEKQRCRLKISGTTCGESKAGQ